MLCGQMKPKLSSLGMQRISLCIGDERKRTSYLQRNMMEALSCCGAALLPLLLEVFSVSKGWWNQKITKVFQHRTCYPASGELGRRQKVSGLSAGQRPPSSHPAAQRALEKGKMECFKTASDEAWPKSHSKLLGENSNLPFAGGKKKISSKVKRA